MPVTANFQVLSLGAKRRAEITEQLAQAFTGLPGRWHVQFIANRSDPEWEVRLSGPAVETSAYVAPDIPPADLAARVRELATG